MAKQLVSDDLWAVVEPLLPPTRPPGTRGHPPVPNRVALAGIIFVLRTGLPWEYFPQELGCCGMTLWRRLRAWQRGGRVGPPAPGAPAAPGGRRADRLAPGQRGRLAASRQRGGRRDGAEPHRPGQAGGAPPPGHGPPRHAAGRLLHGRERERGHRPGAARRRDPGPQAAPRAAGPPASAARRSCTPTRRTLRARTARRRRRPPGRPAWTCSRRTATWLSRPSCRGSRRRTSRSCWTATT